MSLPKGFARGLPTDFERGKPIKSTYNFPSKWLMKWHLMLIISIVALSSMVTLYAVYSWYLDQQVPWEMNKVNSVLQGALDTNNVERKVTYINDAIKMLEPYHGNSGWWNPTASTDIDMAKRVLADTAADVTKQIPVQDKDQWVLLPHEELNNYLNTEIHNGKQRIYDYGNAWKSNGHTHPYFITFPIFVIIGLLVSMISLIKVCDGNEQAPSKVYFDGECPCGRIIPPMMLRKINDYWIWDTFTCSCTRPYVEESDYAYHLAKVKYAVNE